MILRTNLRVTGITARPGNVRGALSSALVDRCLPEAQTNPSLLARRASRQIGSERWRVPALNSGRDVLTGDFLLLTSFCLYKQVAAIVLAPSFPGWLAPLTFDPTRFTELVGFIITVTGTWVACSMLNGDYEHPAESARLLEFPVWDDCIHLLCAVRQPVMKRVGMCRYATGPDKNLPNLACIHTSDGCSISSGHGS